MEFLKRLFGGGAQGNTGDRAGMYFYVQPTGCQEVVRVRINLNNDLTLADDESGYFVYKSVRGTSYKCTRSVELNLYFDRQRRLNRHEITGGTLVDEAAYTDWLATEAAGAQSS